MSQNFYDKELQNFSQGANSAYSTVVIPTATQDSFIDVITPQKQKIRKMASHRVVAQVKQVLSIAPSTAISTGLLNGGTVDFRLEQSVDCIDYLSIKISVQNATGAACTIVPSQMLVQRIDIFANNGGNLLCQFFGQELYLSNIFLSTNEFLNMSGGLKLGADYKNDGVAYANGDTDLLYIHLFQPFFPTKLMQEGLKSNLLVRVLFNTSAMNLISGTGLPNVSNIECLISGRDQPDFVNKRMLTYYRDPVIPIQLNFTNIQRMTTTLTLAPDGNYNIVLSSILGLCSTFVWTIRASPVTSANCNTYIRIKDSDITDNSNASILGYYRRNSDDGRNQYAETFDNLFRYNQSIHVTSFSTDPVGDSSVGSVSGGVAFTTYEKINWTCLSDLVAGSYQIDVAAFMYDNLIINNGNLTSTRGN